MKPSSSSLRGAVLVLFMVVLVLLSLFWFLYRGWGPLEEQAQQAEVRATRIVGLEEELRQKDDALTAVQATVTAVAGERDTAIANHQLAESETIAQQTENNVLLTRVFTQEMQIADQTAVPPSLPQAAILEPAAGSVIQVGAPVTVVVVAADDVGLATVLMTVAGEVVSATLAGEPFQVVRLDWTPQAIGEYTMVVTAVNTAQTTSLPTNVTIQVEDMAAETAVFQQTVADIVGALPTSSGGVSEPQALVENGRDQLAANLLFLRAFDFPLPEGEAIDVARLGDYCDLTAVAELPAGPFTTPEAQLAYIRVAVRQQQLDSHALNDKTAVLTNEDERAALCALAEGHVRLAQEIYITQAAPEMQAGLQANLDNDLLIMPGIFPDIVNEQQLFPTAEGLNFVRQLYETTGDFSAVETAWQQPPQSTEQILHPEKYQAGESLEFLDLPSLADVLPPGWLLTRDGVMGEWLIGQYLRQRLNGETAGLAASGWNGDRYALYANPDDDGWVMVWRTAWDSPEEAAEFAGQYDVYLTDLLGAPGLAQSGLSDIRCWDGRSEAACIYPAETQVVVVRAPDKATAQEVLEFVLTQALLNEG